MYSQFACSTIRPDKLYSEATLLDLLDMEPDDLEALAEWRDMGVGPSFTTLPNGEVRYYGEAILSFVLQPTIGDDPNDPRNWDWDKLNGGKV